MSKTKIIIGGVAVVAIAATAAHFAAPSFFENQFRSYLTNPKSELHGEFDNFALSLFGGTMSATDVSLRTADGATITGDTVKFEQVNWLTLLNANPFGDTLAGSVTVDNGQIENKDARLSSPAPSLIDLRIIQKDGTIHYAAKAAELPGIHVEDGLGRTAKADLIALEDITESRLGGLTLQNLSLVLPSEKQSLSIETASFSDCDVTQSFETAFDLSEKPFDLCSALSGTGVLLERANKEKITLASFGFDGLSSSGAQAISLTEVTASKDDKPQISFGEIALTNLKQSIRSDAFDSNNKLDAREWQHLIDNLSVDAFSVTEMSSSQDEFTTKLGSVAVNGLKDGEVAKLAVSDFQFDLMDHEDKPVFKLGHFEISKVSLSRMQQIVEMYGTPTSNDPMAQIEKAQNQTLGDLGILLSPMVYESFLVSDLSLSGNTDANKNLKFGIDRASASIGDPVRFYGNGTTFAKKGRSAVQGMYIELPNTSPVKDLIASMTGLENFDRLSLNGKINVTWDDQSGVYTYDIEETSIDDIGSISLSASVGNLTPEIMGELNSTRLDQTEKLRQIALTKTSFNGARLEVQGEKLVKIFLRLAAQGNGQTAEDLQLVGAMVLMQTQEKFAQYPRLSNALTELVDWFSNPQHLIITLAPDAPVPFGVLAAGGMQPPATADLLGLTIQANENAK